jgi:hypothetical protein
MTSLSLKRKETCSLGQYLTTHGQACELGIELPRHLISGWLEMCFASNNDRYAASTISTWLPPFRKVGVVGTSVLGPRWTVTRGVIQSRPLKTVLRDV